MRHARMTTSRQTRYSSGSHQILIESTTIAYIPKQLNQSGDLSLFLVGNYQFASISTLLGGRQGIDDNTTIPRSSATVGTSVVSRPRARRVCAMELSLSLPREVAKISNTRYHASLVSDGSNEEDSMLVRSSSVSLDDDKTVENQWSYTTRPPAGYAALNIRPVA